MPSRGRGRLKPPDEFPTDPPDPAPVSERPVSAVAHVMEGFRFVSRSRAIFALLLLLSLVSLMGTTTVAAGGAFCLVGGLLFLQCLPRLRGEARQLILAQQVVPAPEPPLSAPLS